MNWIRQAAEYIVWYCTRRQPASGPSEADVVSQGKALHAKLIQNHAVQWQKGEAGAGAGNYPKRRTGLLQSSLETTVYKEGDAYLVRQRVNLDLLKQMAAPTRVLPAHEGSYPGLLYERGYKSPTHNLMEAGLNVVDEDPFSPPPTNLTGVTVMFTAQGV